MMMTIMIIMKVKASHPPTVGTTVIKNCEPFVFGPALAMLTVYGRSCLKLRWNSSSNSPPQMDSPPVPSPEKQKNSLFFLTTNTK